MTAGDTGDTGDAGDTGLVLAVDLGLACGLAWFRGDGALHSYRSRSFKNVGALKASVLALVDEHPLALLAVEGDRHYADIWRKAASKRGVACVGVKPEVWRAAMLLPREQHSGADAKQAALRLAEKIIDDSGTQKPRTALLDDVAEAIALGRYACAHLLRRR